MARIILALATDLSVAAMPVAAKGYHRGLKAYSAGDLTTAIKEWLSEVNSGEPISQINLGIIYSTGTGTSQDYVKAVGWYRLAADQGIAKAQYALGFMYYKGYGTRQDYFKSVRWWKLAAEQGYAKAQFNLGIMYANGNGLVQDNVIAQM